MRSRYEGTASISVKDNPVTYIICNTEPPPTTPTPTAVLVSVLVFNTKYEVKLA